MFKHETAFVKNSKLADDVKIYRGGVVIDSVLSSGVSVGDDTTIERSQLSDYATINRRSYINDSWIGKYSYSGINTTMNFVKLGNFCSLARNVDIGGFDHDYHKFTTMPTFRFKQMMSGYVEVNKHIDYCEIGNDVWIAAGAIILHKVKVGDGAVVGAGAVVTKDVPPYAIVVGVPAKIIGYRCSQKNIDELLEMNLWAQPDNVLMKIVPYLINTNISDENIDKLKEIICMEKKKDEN